MENTINKPKEILSYPTMLLLVEMIKKFKQEDKKDEIIDVVMAVANDVKTKDNITAKAIKDEVEEKFKNELATKEFVRAEISDAKYDIVKWMIGSQIAVGGLIIAILKFF
ncbi:hypothetical protein HPMG_01165 [Helicobacter pullorum MIT 98-5489]|uniref:DUF1640 domain-containing protein n=1 Tax=Helicobacter pullorum MIT 98-5489 TaxID=537972 RepID=C5F0B4_9HELI|nr:hypothetical protein [Helicobacter pullorum]HEH5010786.1 hypothetical protein [Campylobacter coli]EEQ63708.1 hypothetical protein HPMG_01165 [Helicobacter pullorum MIT 98-5489]HEH5040807.1 hypothetical protein [Campylobacter coli]HEH5151860.1 hypothetical protein [Campylobacter coli]HEH5389590.1 hypothetical protein [Campylobacter coli]